MVSINKSMDEITGINICFGVYNKDETTPNKANTQTIFLMPSFANRVPILFVNNKTIPFETVLNDSSVIYARSNENVTNNNEQAIYLAADDVTDMPPRKPGIQTSN